MIRLIKRWWFLRQLRKDCLGHDVLQTQDFLQWNKKVFVARHAFVIYIAIKSTRRWRYVLLWRLKENSKKLKYRLSEYNSIIDSCIRDGYMDTYQGEAKNDLLKPIALTTERCARLFFRVSSSGDAFLGIFPLIQELLSKYYLAWTVIILPLLAGSYGSPYIKKLLENLLERFI